MSPLRRDLVVHPDRQGTIVDSNRPVRPAPSHRVASYLELTCQRHIGGFVMTALVELAG